MSYPKVSIIILNWNGWEDTIECLESLYQINYPNENVFFVDPLLQKDGNGYYDVIVVDNGSEDKSLEKIRLYLGGNMKVISRYFDYSCDNKPIKFLEYTREEIEMDEFNYENSSKNLIIIKNSRNCGFAEGNNSAIRYALKALDPDYVLLLNNDTVVDKDFLGNMIEFAVSNDTIGIVGPKVFCYDNPDKVQHSTLFKLPYQKKTDTVVGCSMLIKKDVIKDVGLLDEEYFAYFEENDFCIRAKRAGYKIICVQNSKIWHKGAGSTGGGFNSVVAYYKTRNKILIARKNFSTCHQILSIPNIIGFVIYHAITALYERKFNVISAMVKGVMWHFNWSSVKDQFK